MVFYRSADRQGQQAGNLPPQMQTTSICASAVLKKDWTVVWSMGR